MSSATIKQFARTFILVVALAYLLARENSEARGLEDQQNEFLDYNQQENPLQQQQQQAASGLPSQQLARLDSDDDDDDDDLGQVQQDFQPQYQPTLGAQQLAAGSDLYNQADQSYQTPLSPRSATAQDLGVAASKHYGHHKHGAKGWLDMGAWTGKKGAFGWYDKHPVGKGRK